MATFSISQTTSPLGADTAWSYLAQELADWQALYSAQPSLGQRFFDLQGQALATALLETDSQAQFSLPNYVTLTGLDGAARETALPSRQRTHTLRGWAEWLNTQSLPGMLRQRLDELEADENPGLAAAAGLVRYATVKHLVYRMLPAGRNVTYAQETGETIPNKPGELPAGRTSAITAASDAIVEGEASGEMLLVPYAPDAQHFFLPQWVALDQNNHLLTHSDEEAEALLGSMQRYVKVLHIAVSLASYMVADPVYQQKRYGMLGQLVNQGRAFARYKTTEIITDIQARVKKGLLNRGLSLSLPYFDDQNLEMRLLEMDVIPSGWIMFVPAFLVLAARREQAKVAQDTRLSPSTRKHLKTLLQMLETAFTQKAGG